MVTKALTLVVTSSVILGTMGVFAFAPGGTGLFGRQHLHHQPQKKLVDKIHKGAELKLNMADSEAQMFQRKSQFLLPSDNVVIDNRPGFLESAGIRVFHWMSRVCVQLGGLNTSNPIVKIVTFVLYQLDIIWSGVDKEYYVKRREIFGPNFVSAASLVVSKFDLGATDTDAIDTRFLTIPQRRGDFLGSTIMNTDHLPQDRRAGKPPRKASLLHVSDRGVIELDEGELDHDDLREAVMQNVLGEEKLKAASFRAEDRTTKAMLDDFANEAKGITDAATLSPIVERFLIRYYHYVLFALPADEIPVDLLYDTFFKRLNYVLYLYGPKWLFNGLLRPIVRPKELEEKLDRVREYYATSPVLEKFVNIPPNDDALSKDGLLELLEMLIGVAALQGTKALAIACMTQMPEGCARAASSNPDALRKAVLEVARLDAPVTGAHCIVDDKDGLKTTIGEKSLTFPRGTVLFTAMTLANTDANRFDCPYVFDPDRQGLDSLTSFNSVGERTGKSPRICPGRNIAIDCVCQMLKAKIDAEQV